MKAIEKYISDTISFFQSLPIYIQVLSVGIIINIIVTSGKFWVNFLGEGIVVFLVLFLFGLIGGIIIFAAHTVGVMLFCKRCEQPTLLKLN